MNPWPVEADVPEVHLPRPGHADLVGTWKYGHTDVRNILERASARETAARVAGGALAKAFLRALGVEVRSHVVQIGAVAVAPRTRRSTLEDFDGRRRRSRPLPRRGGQPRDGQAHQRAAQGERVDRRRLRGRSSSASSPASARTSPGRSASTAASPWRSARSRRIKGVEFGDGFDVAGDARARRPTTRSSTRTSGYVRHTNHSGGPRGRHDDRRAARPARGAMKPLPTLTKPLRSVDISTHEPAQALRERTDSCVVPGGGRRRRGDGRARARRRLPRRSSAATTSTTCAPPSPPTATRIGWPPPAAAAGLPGGPLVFIGFMGAGKTTLAREAARRAGGAPAVDTDRCVEARARAAHRGVLRPRRRGGVPRARGAASSASCSTAPTAASIVAGRRRGRAPRSVREALARHTVVLCEVERRARLVARGAAAGRPLARDRARLRRALRRAARPVYERLADVFLPRGLAATSWPRALAAPGRAGRRPGGTRLLWARSASGDYPVLGRPRRARRRRLAASEGRRFCVTDETVGAALRRPRPGADAASSRSRRASRPRRSRPPRRSGARWSRRARRAPTTSSRSAAASSATSRASAAATFQRGIPVVQVPTTLVAQVDSAYGGKTGVDLPEAKNYVGAYHQPGAVIVDPTTLATLPPEELAAGYAEVRQDRAHRRRPAVGARRRRRRGRRRRRSSPARARSSPSSPPTSATAAGARC